MNLIDSYGKRGVNYNLLTRRVDVEDTSYLSKYFKVSDLPVIFEAGRNSVSVNGSELLKAGSEILVECHDSADNLLFVEMARATSHLAYKEATSYVISIHVYNDNSSGTGKLVLYGTTVNNNSVRWISNINIDKTKKNTSKVRFYTTPTFAVDSVQIPVIDTANDTITKRDIVFTGSFYGLAVNPPKDTSNLIINRRTVDIDYRFTFRGIGANAPDVDSINTQMIGTTFDAHIYEIQKPFTVTGISPPSKTASFTIKNVIDNDTLQVTDPYFFIDSQNHQTQIITNINQASASISYPYIGYNDGTTTYLTTSIGGLSFIVKQSYADVTYNNIKAFSGYVARHKIYRKSMLQNSDFSIAADEPLFFNELLMDSITPNKFYEQMGVFQKDLQIRKYWFSSSLNLTIVHSPEVLINSMKISPTNYSLANGTEYVMVKNDSVVTNRNAIYVPFTQSQFDNNSGSAYDSNFIEVEEGVQYILSMNAVLEKDQDTDARVDFYFTSSVSGVEKEPTYTADYGIKLGELSSLRKDKPLKRFDNALFFYTPAAHLYGTLIIVPYKCKVSLQNLSFRTYGDDGFSPDSFTTRVPWPINVAGETFQIKAELFDVNSNLVYSDLYTVQNFDPSGSTLIPFVPGGIDLADIYIPALASCQGDITQSRYVKWGYDTAGALCRSSLIDVDHDSAHLMMTLATTATPGPGDPVDMRQSLATVYNEDAGRKIYWVLGVKTIEIGSVND